MKRTKDGGSFFLKRAKGRTRVARIIRAEIKTARRASQTLSAIIFPPEFYSVFQI